MKVFVISGNRPKHGRSALAARFIEPTFGFHTSVKEIPMYMAKKNKQQIRL
ncbi:hypothetical protein [Paenisporosarcina indica]|uniref:hypothetical protein n=1 Tax=Paenisporosarcina indica TaxID=650093 RepID=UPI000A869100|nr:hypothetical protein [Paenisporosarcina indica]